MMPNTPTARTSVADSLRDARVALRSALYEPALELLDGCEDWPSEQAEEAIILKAETLGRRDAVGAVSYLSSVEDLFTTTAGRFAFALELGKAHAAVRGFSQAETRYADARALAGAVPNGAHSMAYHDLRMRWLRRECDPFAPEAALAVAHPDPSIASAAFAYRAWLHAGIGDYAEHIADLTRAVAYATVPSQEPVDVTTLAISTHALARVAFETADGPALAAARNAAEAIAWTPDVAVQHFETIRAFGWDAFMRGRAAEAQWAFKDARNLAPHATWRVMAHLDRAYVARMSGNEFWAAEELAQADTLAYDISWAATRGEERQLLVMLAVLHARTDAPRAQRYASAYAQMGTESIDPSLAAHSDRRGNAFAKYAEGRIEQTLGRRDPAVAALTESYRIFDAAAYRFRAALTATALAELTGDDRWRAAAVRHASAYPDCPLAAHAHEAVTREEAMPAELSPLQRQIARALCAGADAAELSRRFSRSLYTIERQIGIVLAGFGVSSRSGLLHEARRRNLA
jgi:DNA-binding CsgD family transcriptional regulator